MKKSKTMAALLCILVLAVALRASAQSQASGTRQGANVNALSLEEGLLGKSIRTQNGEDVGEIEDVILKKGRVSQVLVDIGGFLGVGEKTVALSLNQLQLGNRDHALFDGTRNDLENMPEVDLYAFRRPYRGYYDPAYGPYGPYGGYGYGPFYGPYRGYTYHGPYGGGSMQGQRDGAYRQGQGQWQERGSRQDQQSYAQQQYPRREYQDSRQGRAGMNQGQQGRQGQMMQGRMDRGMSGDLFIGAQVVNQWNENLGEVEDLVIDPSTGRVTHAVIEIGGFWDIGDEHVLVPYNQLRQLDPYYVMYRGTEEQLEQMPAYQKGEGGRVTGLKRQQTQRAGGQGGGQAKNRQRQSNSQNQQQ